MIGEVIIQVTASSVYYISTHLLQNKVSFSNISKEIGIPKFERNTDFTIGGFLASPPRSPLIVCSSFQVSQVILLPLKLEAFSLLILLCTIKTFLRHLLSMDSFHTTSLLSILLSRLLYKAITAPYKWIFKLPLCDFLCINL